MKMIDIDLDINCPYCGEIIGFSEIDEQDYKDNLVYYSCCEEDQQYDITEYKIQKNIKEI